MVSHAALSSAAALSLSLSIHWNSFSPQSDGIYSICKVLVLSAMHMRKQSQERQRAGLPLTNAGGGSDGSRAMKVESSTHAEEGRSLLRETSIISDVPPVLPSEEVNDDDAKGDAMVLSLESEEERR